MVPTFVVKAVRLVVIVFISLLIVLILLWIPATFSPKLLTLVTKALYSVLWVFTNSVNSVWLAVIVLLSDSTLVLIKLFKEA